MIPPLPTRPIDLRARILQRHAPIRHHLKHALITQPHLQPAHEPLPLRRLAIQPAAILGGDADAQLLHGGADGVVLALEGAFVRLALGVVVKLRGAVDGPVAHGAQAREPEGARRAGVGEEVAD